jgi:iron complex transport system substrate-binding protein
VLSVAGDLIIASDRAGPPEVIKVLKASPVRYVEIADDFSPSSVAAKTRQIAHVVGLESAGNQLAARIERDFEKLAELRGQIKQPMRVLFVLNVANGRATVGGSHSSADAILRLAGAENAAAAVNGYKPISDEALVEVRPDAVVAMRRSGSGHEADHIASMKGLSTSPAVKNKRIIEMDGLYLLGFGPRAPAAALELMRALYPDLPFIRAGLGK